MKIEIDIGEQIEKAEKIVDNLVKEVENSVEGVKDTKISIEVSKESRTESERNE